MSHLQLAFAYLGLLVGMDVLRHARSVAVRPPAGVAAPRPRDVAIADEVPRAENVTAPQLYAQLSRIVASGSDPEVSGCGPRTEDLRTVNELAIQARIIPAFRDGRAVGFKLFSIRPGSVYEKVGIQNGDVVTRVNGFDLDSPEKALELYSAARHATRFVVELERQGKAMTLAHDTAEAR